MIENINDILPTGTELKNGKYEIRGLVRSSQMSNVYLVKEKPDLGRSLIIKQFSPKSRTDENISNMLYHDDVAYGIYREAFVYEKQTIVNIKDISSDLDTYYVDFFMENKGLYLVLRKLEGCTLGEYIVSNEKITDDEKLKLFSDLLDAVVLIHKKKVLHGDISPDNIFLIKDKRIMLIDFGNSVSIKQIRLFQKPGYSAPEMYGVEYGAIGLYSDIYSLGAVLYFMLSGKAPGYAYNNSTIELSRNINIFFRHYIQKCLDQNPRKRFHSIRMMKFALCFFGIYQHRKLFYAIFIVIIFCAIITSDNREYSIRNHNNINQFTTIKDNIFSYETTIKNEAIIIGSEARITEVEIPETIDGYRVVSIQRLNNNVVDVVISDGIENIEDYAFRNCQYLKRITIPKSVKYIGDNTFYNCGSLEEIEISDDNPYFAMEKNKLIDKKDNRIILKLNEGENDEV